MKLGKKVKANISHNCTSCALFISCQDKRKAYNYCCTRYKRNNVTVDLDFVIKPKNKPAKKETKKSNKTETNNNTDDKTSSKKRNTKYGKPDKKFDSKDEEEDFVESFNVENIVNGIIKENERGISPDLKIDDRDLKEAKNVFQFATDKYYLGWHPFPKQLEVVLQFFNDYCVNPKCTDLKYVRNIPTHTDYQDYSEIQDRITFLEFGKCPKCGWTREVGWEKGIYHPYTELVGLAGQRCVHYDTLVYTPDGLHKIGELFKDAPYGWTDYSGLVGNVHGEWKKATKLFKAEPEQVRRITLTDGTVLTGTLEHPIMTSRGMVKLQHINKLHYVPIYLGQNIFGLNTSANISDAVTNEDVPLEIRTGTRHLVIEYLYELFAVAGIVHSQKNKLPCLEFCFMQLNKALTVKCMLQNLGIAACIEHCDQPIVEKSAYCLRVYGQYISLMIPIIQLSKKIANLLNTLIAECKTKYFYEKPYLIVESADSPPKPDFYVRVAKVEDLPIKCVTYDFHIPDTHQFYGNGINSSNSGKSSLVALMSAYLIHKYLKLQNPIKILGLQSNATIHGVYIALTMKQARETLFDPLHDILADSAFFINYHQLLDYYGQKYGVEFYKFKDTIINYRHRRLNHYPSVPNKGTLRGRALYSAACDELSYFSSESTQSGGKLKHDADEIHGALNRAMTTVKSAVRNLRDEGMYHMTPPMMCNISSPTSIFDKMCRLLALSKGSKSIYGFHYSVFQFNPKIKPEDLEDELRDDPIRYRRDYLAIPPSASSAFINDNNIIKNCINRHHKNMIYIKQNTSISNTGSKMTTGKVKFKRRDSGVPRLLGIDAGAVFNAFSGCVMSFNHEDMPQVDALFEVVPVPDYPINFNHVYHRIIVPIIKNLGIKFICTDRWQSIRLLDDAAEDFEIGTETYSVNYADFIQLRSALVDGDIVLPAAEMSIKDAMKLAGKNYPSSLIGYPVSHFNVQCLTVEEILGKTIAKGERKTDDLFRAFVLAYTKLLDPEVQSEWLLKTPPKPRSTNIGTVVSYGSGGGSRISGNIKTGVVISRGSGGGSRLGGSGMSSHTFGGSKMFNVPKRGS